MIASRPAANPLSATSALNRPSRDRPSRLAIVVSRRLARRSGEVSGATVRNAVLDSVRGVDDGCRPGRVVRSSKGQRDRRDIPAAGARVPAATDVSTVLGDRARDVRQGDRGTATVGTVIKTSLSDEDAKTLQEALQPAGSPSKPLTPRSCLPPQPQARWTPRADRGATTRGPPYATAVADVFALLRGGRRRDCPEGRATTHGPVRHARNSRLLSRTPGRRRT